MVQRKKKKKIKNQNHQQLICKNHHKWIAIIYRENPGIVTGVESGTEEVSGRAAVAEDNTGTRVFLVVLLGKRGRVCHKNQVALKTGRSVLWANIFFTKCHSSSYSPTFVHSLQNRSNSSAHCPTVQVRLSAPSFLLHSDFNVLLNAELRKSLFDSQRCQACSSVSIPTFPHDFTHHPQGLTPQQRKKEQS